MSYENQCSSLVKVGFLAGIIAGLGIGLFFKVVERLWNIKVYTLLLNIDYIPVINRLTLTENVEFLLHLFISILISVCFLFILYRWQWPIDTFVRFTIIGSLLIGLILFPTTELSERTPDFTDIPALFFWIIGHILYGALLGALFKRNENI